MLAKLKIKYLNKIKLWHLGVKIRRSCFAGSKWLLMKTLLSRELSTLEVLIQPKHRSSTKAD